MKLVVATTNQGKLRELRELFEGTGVELISMKDALGRELEIVEDGLTFEENAAIKARAVSAASGLATLADDSGLEVDALGGRPGIHSARFSGPSATDASNREALLRALEEVAEPAPRARFRCVLALIVPEGSSGVAVQPGDACDGVIYFSGACEGHIERTPRGGGGFGYDPIFVPMEGDGRTMAELDLETKNRISHRGKAFAKLRAALVA